MRREKLHCQPALLLRPRVVHARTAPHPSRRCPAVWALVACGALLVTPRHAVAAERWADVRQVGPFVCQATFSLAPYDDFFEEFQTLESELVRVLGITPAKRPLYVYLFSDSQSHRRYLQEHYPGVPYRRALFVQESGRAAVYAYRHEEMELDIRHEGTHALLHASLPVVPLWLDEGLAKYFEVPPDQRAFDHPYFGSLRWNMRLGTLRAIEELEQADDLTEMGALEYRYAWAWVHFMLHGPTAAHETLVHYLKDVHRGVPVEPMSQRLAATLPHANRRMVQHFKFWRR